MHNTKARANFKAPIAQKSYVHIKVSTIELKVNWKSMNRTLFYFSFITATKLSKSNCIITENNGTFDEPTLYLHLLKVGSHDYQIHRIEENPYTILKK